MPGEDNLRVWLFRLRRAAVDGSFPVRPRIKVGITRAMGAALMRSLRKNDRVNPIEAVDGRACPTSVRHALCFHASFAIAAQAPFRCALVDSIKRAQLSIFRR
jgi:hypothetical protein